MTIDGEAAYRDLVDGTLEEIVLPPDPLDVLDRHFQDSRVDLPELCDFGLLLPSRPRLALLDELDELQPDRSGKRIKADMGESKLVGFRDDRASC